MNHFSKVDATASESVDKLPKKIADSITNSKYDWRTPKSLAKELGLSETIVQNAMNGSGGFVRAQRPNPQGEFLYTTPEIYRKIVPFAQRLLGAAANTVSQ